MAEAMPTALIQERAASLANKYVPLPPLPAGSRNGLVRLARPMALAILAFDRPTRLRPGLAPTPRSLP